MKFTRALYVVLKRPVSKLLMIGVFLSATNAAFALPSLQIGPDGDANWSYVGATGFGSTNTWLYTGMDPFGFSVYGNALGSDGGNGAYPFNDTFRTAYLVVAAVPKPAGSGGGDLFEITVSGDGGSVSVHEANFGQPPTLDSNSLAPHGVYDTWFEIYQFEFDGTLADIGNTQPPPSGETGKGYVEGFTIDVISTAALVEGLHIDLFTVRPGTYDPATTPAANNLVSNFAPFSHDAEWHPENGGGGGPSQVPEPVVLALFGLGLLGVGAANVRRKKKKSVDA